MQLAYFAGNKLILRRPQCEVAARAKASPKEVPGEYRW